MIHRVAGYCASGIFALLGALHVSWALGLRSGWDVVLPTSPGGARLLAPTRATTWAVALALFGASATLLCRLGHWQRFVPRAPVRWATRAIGVLFLLRAVGDFRMVGFWKTIKGTPFARWDTHLFSPLCIGIAALVAIADWLPDDAERP